jgi:hypothetical protein
MTFQKKKKEKKAQKTRRGRTTAVSPSAGQAGNPRSMHAATLERDRADGSSSSGVCWYGREEAASWSLERPPDRDADFNGDVAQWDVARDVWYKKATQGKELPAATDAVARKIEWERALGARRSRIKRKAQSEAQAEARRAKQAECMQRLRADMYEAELQTIAQQLKAEEAALVIDNSEAVLRRSRLVLPMMQKLVKQGRHLEVALFGLHALVPAIDSHKWVDLWGGPLYAFRYASDETFDVFCEKPSPTFKPHPDTLRVVCVIANALQQVALWEHASHWWEVAACIKSEARYEECDDQTLSCELQSILCQITAEELGETTRRTTNEWACRSKGGPSADSLSEGDAADATDESEFRMELLIARLLLVDKELGECPRGRARRELREICIRTTIECLQRLGRLDDALLYVRRHTGLRAYGSVIKDYEWDDVLRMLQRHAFTLRVAAGHGLSPREWLNIESNQQRNWLVEAAEYSYKLHCKLGLLPIEPSQGDAFWRTVGEKHSHENAAYFESRGWKFTWYADPWLQTATALPSDTHRAACANAQHVAALHATVQLHALECRAYAKMWKDEPGFHDETPRNPDEAVATSLSSLPSWFCTQIDRREEVTRAAASWSAILAARHPPDWLPEWARACFDPDDPDRMPWCGGAFRVNGVVYPCAPTLTYLHGHVPVSQAPRHDTGRCITSLRGDTCLRACSQCQDVAKQMRAVGAVTEGAKSNSVVARPMGCAWRSPEHPWMRAQFQPCAGCAANDVSPFEPCRCDDAHRCGSCCACYAVRQAPHRWKFSTKRKRWWWDDEAEAAECEGGSPEHGEDSDSSDIGMGM